MFERFLNENDVKKNIPGADYKYFSTNLPMDIEDIIDKDGRYDMNQFSESEDSYIKSIIENANRNYPQKYRAFGLANESYSVTRKPRYVLHEAIITAFKDSNNPFDILAVALAYETKGSFYRESAVKYFEDSIDKIDHKELNEFHPVSVFSIFIAFSKVYEREHEYLKSIECLKVAEKFTEENSYIIGKINNLEQQQKSWKPLRRAKMKEEQALFEREIHQAALNYVALIQK